MSSSYSKSSSNRIQTGSNLNGLYLGYLRTSPDFDIREYKGTNYRISNGVTTVTPNSHRGYRRNTGSYRVFDNAQGSYSYAAPTYNNPLWTINEQKNLATVDRIIFAPELSYTVNDKLSFTGRYSIDFYQDNRVNYWPAGSAGDGRNGLWDEDRITNRIGNLNIFALGSFDINDDIDFNYTVGYQSQETNYRRLSATESNFTNPDQEFLNPGNTTGDNSTPGAFTSIQRQSGGYAVLDFTLYENLLVQISGRAETLSTLPNAGIIFYPSASVGYKLTDLISSDFIDFFKVRASYGEVGIGANPYSTSTVYSTGGIRSSWGDGFDGALYGNPFTQSSVKGNPDLKEERKVETEFGFDIRILNNDLSFSATYYQNKINDGIISLPLPTSSGFTSSVQNAAEIENKGIEFDLNYNIIQKKDFGVSINANFNANRNKLLTLRGSAYTALNGFTSTSSGYAEGHAIGVMRSGVWARDDSGKLILGNNNFPTADANKKVGAGDPNPDFRAGFGTNIRFKNFSLTSVFETSQGNDVWNGTYGVLRYFGIHPDTADWTTNNTGKSIYTSGGKEIANGDSFRGYIKDFGGGDVAVDWQWWTSNGGGFGDVGEQFIMDGSWLKLREITLNYDFDSSLVEKLGMSDPSLSVYARNILLWTAIDENILGFDPENNLTGASRGRGLEYFSNPGSSSILTTLRLKF